MLEIPIILKDYWNFLQDESIETLISFFDVYNNYFEQEQKIKIEEEKEKRSWQLYVSIYPNFDNKNFMTYAKFIEKNGTQSNSNVKKVEVNDSDKMTKNDILLLAEIKRKKWEEEKA